MTPAASSPTSVWTRYPGQCGTGAWQTDQDQRLSQRAQSATVPGCGVYPPHGLRRDQRPGSGSTEATQEACGFRWKIEQLHREGKQVTGLERCQCRTARIQRNHIGCALLVWVRLKALAAQTGRTVYQLKHGLLDDYLVQQLRNPSLRMVLA